MAADSSHELLLSSISQLWDGCESSTNNFKVFPYYLRFLRVPNSSPAFSPTFYTDGLTINALNVLIECVQKSGLVGVSELKVVQQTGIPPLLCMVVEAFNTESKCSVLLYQHADKVALVSHLF